MNELELTGLDGGNPLGFLAALGTLRALTRAWPDQDVRMSWTATAGWRPVLHQQELNQKEIVIDALHCEMQAAKDHETLKIADDLTISTGDYRRHLIDQLSKQSQVDHLSYASAFGCDGIDDGKGNIADTALRTMSGAGHQHFLKTMRNTLKETTREQICKTEWHLNFANVFWRKAFGLVS